MKISLKPIGTVHSSRTSTDDDNWGNILSEIILLPPFDSESIQGIDKFSHLEILFFFHQVEEEKITFKARHPRNNRSWPKVGIFSQRGKNRPNRIGSTMVTLQKSENNSLFVWGLDAIEGTPVLDIKPVFNEFLPKHPIIQPKWTRELMQNYWKIKEDFLE